MDFIRRGIRAKPSVAAKVTRTILAIAVPTFLRWFFVDSYGAPFVLYFPAILMVAVLIDWRHALVTAIASAVVGVFMFWPAEYLADFGQSQIAILVMFALSAGAMIAIGHLFRESVLEIEERVRQSEDFNRELQHRTKNALQMMRALASRASKATDPAEFYETLGGRLGALAKANELLRFGALEACSMQELMQAALAPFNVEQISVSGPDCRVSRGGCTPLMMAVHELGTNASKYGALSQDGGRVTVTWQADDAAGRVTLLWTETGGPPVDPPTRKGLGARLLMPSGDVRDVTVDYRREGVVCRLSVAQA